MRGSASSSTFANNPSRSVNEPGDRTNANTESTTQVDIDAGNDNDQSCGVSHREEGDELEKEIGVVLPKDTNSLDDIEMAGGEVGAGDEEKAINRNCSMKVARDEYEVGWINGNQDPENPRAMSKSKKWIATLGVSGSTLCVTYTSSIYASIYGQIIKEFNISPLVAVSGLSLFIIGLGIGPMLLAPLSEFYGRRPIYISSLSAFFLFLIPCTVAKNIETMLIGRFLGGISGSAFLSVAGGTVGDMFSGTELGAPMMVYTLGAFIGPVIGPLVGGFIAQHTTWHWIFYTLLIWTLVMLILIYFFVPETYHPILLRKKAERLRRSIGDDKFYAPIEKQPKRSISHAIAISCLRPFQLLVFEPIVMCLCVFTAIFLGILYIFFQAFPIVFGQNGVYGFDLETTGLTFLGLLVGVILAVLSDPIWKKCYVHLQNKAKVKRKAKSNSDKGTNREMEEEKGDAFDDDDSDHIIIPEHRLPQALLGSILCPLGLFIFGFTATPSIHCIVPIAGSAIFALGTILSFSGAFAYLVDAYPLYAASALAANSFVRSSFAAGFPLFSYKLYDGLGVRWGGALLGFMCLLMVPFIFIIYRWGGWIRGFSRYSSPLDPSS